MSTAVKSKKKSILDDADLYGMEVCHLYLVSQGYLFISSCNGSVPTPGSQCFMILLRPPKKEFFEVKISKTIRHKNGDVTFQTDKGFFRYSK